MAALVIYQFQTRQDADAQGLVPGSERTVVQGDVLTGAAAGGETGAAADAEAAGGLSDDSQTIPGTLSSVRLEVPLIMQMPKLPTGCEATATAMMLQYAGSSLTKLDVAAEMPYSDDPYQGFVGDPFTESGYTIYPQALTSLVRAQLGSAVDLSGASLADVRAFLQDGKPVCCWIADDQGYVHCVVVTGYEDGVVFLNDPLEGHTTMTASEFEHVWDNNARRALSY
ncbi:MAG: C39 family peptidase [Coriobacteriales bacterium]|nr:C39 family peptidase [Coriobacteriales bacterium]